MSGVDYVEDPFVHLVSITIDLLAVGNTVIMHQWRIIEGEFGSSRYIGIAPPPTAEDFEQTWELQSDNAIRLFYSQSYGLVGASPEEKGTPTFLVGGHRPVSGGDAIGEIHRSTDGYNWDLVYSLTLFFGPSGGGVGSGQGVVGIVWHPADQRFYALFTGAEGPWNPDDPPVGFAGKILSSPDGDDWSDYSEIFSDQASAEAAFRDLCAGSSKPENTDGVSDGYQGYDATKKIFIKPTPAGDGIVIEADGIPQAGGDGLPSTGIWAISFAGGVWNALVWKFEEEGSPTEIYGSIDDGQSWELVFATTGSNVTGLSAAPATDFEDLR